VRNASSLHLSSFYFRSCIIIETKEDPDNKKSAKAVLKVNKELDWETYDTLYLIITVEDLNTNSDYTDKQSSSGKFMLANIQLLYHLQANCSCD